MSGLPHGDGKSRTPRQRSGPATRAHDDAGVFAAHAAGPQLDRFAFGPPNRQDLVERQSVAQLAGKRLDRRTNVNHATVLIEHGALLQRC
jgi:hypothetical protein